MGAHGIGDRDAAVEPLTIVNVLERVLFASRRGFCAGVERAVAVVNAGGLTSGTSVPEYLVGRVCARFAARGAEIAQRPFVPEDVFLRLRAVIRGSG